MSGYKRRQIGLIPSSYSGRYIDKTVASIKEANPSRLRGRVYPLTICIMLALVDLFISQK